MTYLEEKNTYIEIKLDDIFYYINNEKKFSNIKILLPILEFVEKKEN